MIKEELPPLTELISEEILSKNGHIDLGPPLVEEEAPFQYKQKF
jgi:hypothetical protein